MANIVKIGEATKIINEAGIEVTIPFNTAFAIADAQKNKVVIKSMSGHPLSELPFSEIDDKYGTSNAQELVDYYAANAFFFQVTSFDPTDIENRLEVLEDNIYEVTYKEIIGISASTNGSVAFPSGATLDETEITGNAVLSLATSGEVEWETPKDGAGNPITVVLGNTGNWVVADTTAQEVAMIFRLRIAAVDMSNLDNDKVIDKFTNDVDIQDKQDKVPLAVEDNIATWNSNGNTKDSGVPVSEIADNTTDITNHVADLANPHDTSIGNIDSGTLAELNAAITNATLDDSGEARTPTAHASTHEEGGSDEIDSVNLLATFTPSNYTPTGTDLFGQLNGIDNALGSGPQSPPYLNETLVITCVASVNLNTGAGVTVPFVTPLRSTIPGISLSPTGVLTLGTAGQYRMSYKINGDDQNNTRKNVAVVIRKNGVQDLPLTVSYSYSRNLTDNLATNSVPMTDDIINMNLLGGETFEIFAFQTGSGGACNSIPTECIWTIEKIV